MNRLAQILGCPGVRPAAFGVATRADLGHDVQRLRVGVKSFLDDLVRDERTVVVTGVEVRDAAFDHLAQYLDRFLAVLRWTENSGTGQLHRAITHSSDAEIRRPRKGAAR